MHLGPTQVAFGLHGILTGIAVFALQSGGLLDDLIHPNKEKYPSQRMFVVDIDDYAWLVPYVENEQELFLKTIIPSRKATKQYLRGQHE